jgi:hypothetical protein
MRMSVWWVQRAAWLIAGALASGCVRQEQSILDEFFDASRLRDKTALAKFATVTFEPLQQGIVVEYTIDKVAVDGGTKQITVKAQVERPDGRTVPETLLVLMQHGGRGWTITGVTEIRN